MSTETTTTMASTVKETASTVRETASTRVATYGIVYGGESRCDFKLSGPFASIEEARTSYDEAQRIRYMDGLLGGASIVLLDRFGDPKRTVETLAEDETLQS